MARSEEVDRPGAALRVALAFYALAILAWYALPWLLPLEGLIRIPLLPVRLYGSPPSRLLPFLLMTAVVYLVPLVALLEIAAAFLARSRRSLPLLLGVLLSAFVLAVILFDLVAFARSRFYFQTCSPATYAVFFLSVAANAGFLYLFIAGLNRRDPAYREYLAFRRRMAAGRGILSRLLHRGIQQRLGLTFIPLILAVVAVLSWVLMRDFSRTILRAVLEEGRSLAERTASVIKANPTDMIGADDYLAIEERKNAFSAFPFKRLAYYQRDPKSEAFRIEAGTDRTQIGWKIAGPVQPFTEAHSRYNPVLEVFEFTAPVNLGGKFIGYVQADYDREVIYEPYFRTQVKVFTIAAVFIYTAIFLIHLFGRGIVFPILILRMSVNGIARKLSGMVGGKIRVSAEQLQYQDRITTRDEIKMLSSEIGNMTAVLRGIVPYISASTLQHAAREKPTTVRKELTFLFTDIRGFTTLCEGLAPEQVVELLNHYLDLQTSIIQDCDGEIDKYVGDEVVARFAGRSRERNACRAGMEIRTAMAREKELAELARRDVVSIGIGIHSGPVAFGSVGARDRMDFTGIGDTVNLAARLEGANKLYGTKTLITEAVYRKVRDLYLCREIDLIAVKGKSRPVRIYELLQESALAGEKLQTMKQVFEEGLEAYRRRRWAPAEKAFSRLRDGLRDETSQVFLHRIEYFKANPPGRGWDGVFHAMVK